MKNDLKRNGSGCLDPTAYQAIMNADAVSSVDKANRYKRRENDSEERLNKLLAAIFAICDAADFHIEERIVVKDKRTFRIKHPFGMIFSHPIRTSKQRSPMSA